MEEANRIMSNIKISDQEEFSRDIDRATSLLS